MKTTGAAISKAIYKKFGVNVKLHKGGGCFHFYSDDEETALKLASLYGTTVYTNQMNLHSVDWWVKEFEEIWNEERNW